MQLLVVSTYSYWFILFNLAPELYELILLYVPGFCINIQTPFQLLHKTEANYLHPNSFRCLCFPWLKPYTSHKLQPKSHPCIFIGYSSSQYAYHCLDPITNKVYTSRHVHFHDNIFPYPSLIATSTNHDHALPSANEPLHTLIPLSTHSHDNTFHASNASNSVPMTVSPLALPSSQVQSSTETPISSETLQASPIISPSPPQNTNTHSMTTKSKYGISLCNLTALLIQYHVFCYLYT